MCQLFFNDWTLSFIPIGIILSKWTKKSILTKPSSLEYRWGACGWIIDGSQTSKSHKILNDPSLQTCSWIYIETSLFSRLLPNLNVFFLLWVYLAINFFSADITCQFKKGWKNNLSLIKFPNCQSRTLRRHYFAFIVDSENVLLFDHFQTLFFPVTLFLRFKGKTHWETTKSYQQ